MDDIKIIVIIVMYEVLVNETYIYVHTYINTHSHIYLYVCMFNIKLVKCIYALKTKKGVSQNMIVYLPTITATLRILRQTNMYMLFRNVKSILYIFKIIFSTKLCYKLLKIISSPKTMSACQKKKTCAGIAL